MSRASRLAEIAKANQPAFSGAHWWLADPSVHHDPGPAKASLDPAAAATPDRVAVEVTDAVAQLSAVGASASGSQNASLRPVATTHLLSTSEAALKQEPEQSESHLATRLGGLKGKFLWLGRKSRAAHS
jgi:hypothetical protein